MVVGELVCFVIYFFFQTTVPRPQLEGTSFTIELVQLIYSRDLPYNCFPSIHVLTSLAIMLGYFHLKIKHILHSIFIYITGTMIIISTLFVKQHVILDIFGALMLTLLTYGIVFELFHFSKLSKKEHTVYLKD
jgi:membrane-associated phospholipid phosphatase